MTDTYFAPAVATRPVPSTVPVLPPAPPRRQRPSTVAALVAVLAAVVGVGVVATTRAAADRGLGQVIAVATDAPASVGWGPAYVDEAGRPGRFDPCTPLHYVVNPRWAPARGRADLAEALRRLSAASGLQLVAEGDTDEVPSQDRSAYQPERYGDRWAPLLLAWVPPEATDLGLDGPVQGVSLSFAVPSRGGPSLVSAQVALDAGNRLAAGFGPGTTDGEVLLHELAHAVGLGHVLDATQVMYPQTTSSESQYGAGDRAGLAAVGAPAGCHPAPPARPLRLATDG